MLINWTKNKKLQLVSDLLKCKHEIIFKETFDEMLNIYIEGNKDISIKDYIPLLIENLVIWHCGLKSNNNHEEFIRSTVDVRIFLKKIKSTWFRHRELIYNIRKVCVFKSLDIFHFVNRKQRKNIQKSTGSYEQNENYTIYDSDDLYTIPDDENLTKLTLTLSNLS